MIDNKQESSLVLVDVPCRSILLKLSESNPRTFCLLIYEKVNAELNRQVVVFEVDLTASSLSGNIVWDVKEPSDEKWKEINEHPHVWLVRELKFRHRKIYGYPMPSEVKSDV